MNPDFSIIVNFKLKQADKSIADKLVKTARNIGVRAVSGPEILNAASEKYTIKLVDEKMADHNINSENIINKLVENRKNGLPTIIEISVDENGELSSEDQALLEKINDWMHMFGHAFNEAAGSLLEVDTDGFVMENRHANYQKYIFLKSPLPAEVKVSGLDQEPNRIEWIEDRQELKFDYQDGVLRIDLAGLDNKFEWQIVRIQAHRPEDDLEETKY